MCGVVVLVGGVFGICVLFYGELHQRCEGGVLVGILGMGRVVLDPIVIGGADLIGDCGRRWLVLS